MLQMVFLRFAGKTWMLQPSYLTRLHGAYARGAQRQNPKIEDSSSVSPGRLRDLATIVVLGLAAP
jgi:hypothetical protein